MIPDRRQPPWRGPATFAVALAVLGLLAGCGQTRQALGLTKNPPDEFQVVSRAPLALPPNYALRPPQPGAARPQEGSVTNQARLTLLGSGEPASAGPQGGTPGERALLTRTGANAADPNIRNLIDRESTQLAEDDKTFIDRVIFWRKPEDQGDVVDAAKETQRIQQNAALGRPANAGDTPTIKRKRRGPLEGLF